MKKDKKVIMRKHIWISNEEQFLELKEMLKMNTSEMVNESLNVLFKKVKKEVEWKKITSDQVGGNHYKKMVIQPVDFITANKMEFLEGNAIKYICRYKSKNGIEDLKKAIHYINLIINKKDL